MEKLPLKMKKILHKVYFDCTSTACYSGSHSVLKAAKKINKKITLKNVNDFLRLQNCYSLHKPVRRKFKRNKTFSAGIDVNWQADLADMKSLKKQNKGMTYLLVCIDVFSRYAFVEPIRNKTPEIVGQALEAIMKRSGRDCYYLATDRGKEFVGKKFQQVLRKHDIHHHCATSPDVKCAIVERYIRTLKGRIWRYFTKNKTLNYMKMLQAIVNATNNSMHRTLGRTPNSITKKNEKEVRKETYEDKTSIPNKQVYKVGDHVRITKEKSVLAKGYAPNFTNEIFVVRKILKNRKPATHKLVDLNGEEVEGIFYTEELNRIANRSVFNESFKELSKSEIRGKQLWHLASMKNGKNLWIRDTRLFTT
jgi:hypothetical protein